jgi:hypothetical protein
VLVAGYKLIVPSGYELSVSFLGKAATWILYASLTLMMITSAGTDFPYILFWIGLALAMAAGVFYVVSVLRRRS